MARALSIVQGQAQKPDILYLIAISHLLKAVMK